MSEMFQELLSSSPYAIIELFELHFNRDLHGTDRVVYFHAGVNNTNPSKDVIWQTMPYSAYPIEVEGFEFNGNGQLPRPKVRVSNLFGNISALLLGVNEVTPGNDLTGAKFIRIRTLSRFLDPINFAGGINPYGTPGSEEMPREIYYIDRKSVENRDIVEFELAAVFDLAGIRTPKRQCIANICQWKYRGPECGYTGTTYFNEADDTVLTEPAPNFAATITTLNLGDNLFSPNQLVSANGWYRAVMQGDGNLVVYSKNDTAVWSSISVYASGSYRLRNQVDGNVTIIDTNSGQQIWQTNTGSTSVGVTGVDFVRNSDGSIAFSPSNILEGRTGAFGWELFGVASAGGSASTSRTFYSPTSISPGRFITLTITATPFQLPAGHFSGQAYSWVPSTIAVTASGGFWNVNETFNASVNVNSNNPFRNTSYGPLTTVGPQIQITSTTGYANNRLVLQNDGNLVLYDGGNRAIWASGYYSNVEPLIVSQAGSLITVDPAKDVCGKRISSCKARFGATSPLPFGSFPSVGSFYG